MKTIFFCLFLCIRITYASLAASGSGSTSQNWDCCKPSCAWPGKANVTTPVQSCDITNNPLTDANTNSSCQNGTSYLCASQAPWVVNPSLAYGFAAATIVGGNETSWCCACYELLFNSGLAKGKKMIVQVTDSVFDKSTSGSQFVLSVRINRGQSCILHMLTRIPLERYPGPTSILALATRTAASLNMDQADGIVAFPLAQRALISHLL